MDAPELPDLPGPPDLPDLGDPGPPLIDDAGGDVADDAPGIDDLFDPPDAAPQPPGDPVEGSLPPEEDADRLTLVERAGELGASAAILERLALLSGDDLVLAIEALGYDPVARSTALGMLDAFAGMDMDDLVFGGPVDHGGDAGAEDELAEEQPADEEPEDEPDEEEPADEEPEDEPDEEEPAEDAPGDVPGSPAGGGGGGGATTPQPTPQPKVPAAPGAPAAIELGLEPGEAGAVPGPPGQPAASSPGGGPLAAAAAAGPGVPAPPGATPDGDLAPGMPSADLVPGDGPGDLGPPGGTPGIDLPIGDLEGEPAVQVDEGGTDDSDGVDLRSVAAGASGAAAAGAAARSIRARRRGTAPTGEEDPGDER